MPASRRTGAALLLVAALVALLVADGRSRVRPPQPDLRTPAVVALGDSAVAGEGTGVYLPGTDGPVADGSPGNYCHRSALASVALLDVAPGTRRFNLGCSGAVAADVGGEQARELGALARRHRVAAVLVAVGANDGPSFADVVLQCAGAWLQRSGPPCREELAGQWPGRLDDMTPRVAATLDRVRATMAGAGYRRGDYDLVVHSYAAPLSERLAPELQDLSGCPFRTGDLRWLRTEAVPALSAALRGAAARAGARFVDLSRAAEGHEACTWPRDPGREWISRLTLDFELLQEDTTALRAVQESFHPNAAGHAAIAGCLSEFLRSPRPEAQCLTDRDGELRPKRRLSGPGS